ncbi:MAG: hypothetical protein AAF266_16970, partial [Planctomycetota bacterium]
MKLLIFTGAAAFIAGIAIADPVGQPTSVDPATFKYDSYYAQPASSLPSVSAPSATTAQSAVTPVSAMCADDGCCGDACCGDACGCGSTCGLGGCMDGLLGDCCLGDAWTLKGEVDP